MKRSIGITLLLAFALCGCQRGIKTKEVWFYRDREVFDGQPVAVEIVYPRTQSEHDQLLNEFRENPDSWFTSKRRREIIKDKDDIIPETRRTVTFLREKPKGQATMIIFAECGTRRESDPVRYNQRRMLVYDSEDDNNKEMRGKKREYIRIRDGYMMRLDRKPRR